MAKFFKNIFSPNSSEIERKRNKIKLEEDENKEFTAPYDTKRKLSISRSGRMKQNLKVRGTLGNDLYGETQKVERKNIEYHVHGKNYLKNSPANPKTKSSSAEELDRLPDMNLHSRETSKSVSSVNCVDMNTSSTSFNKENKRKPSRGSINSGSIYDSGLDIDKEIEKVFNIVETAL